MIGAALLLEEILSFLRKPKNWLNLALVGFIVFGLYKAGHYIYDSGKQAQLKIDKPLIEKANKDRDTAIRERAEYVAAFKLWKDTSDKLAESMKAKHEAEMARTQAELEAAKKLAEKRKQELRDAIPHFIPPDADPYLSVGFVCLHNLSYEADTAAGDSPFPASGCGDARASSGIRLSEYAEVLVGNADEAVSNRTLVLKWQQWYTDRQAEVNAAIEAQKAAAPPPSKETP